MPLTKLAKEENKKNPHAPSDAEMQGATLGVGAGLGAGIGLSHGDAAVRAWNETRGDLKDYDERRARNFRVIDLPDEPPIRFSYQGEKGQVIPFPNGQQMDKRKDFARFARQLHHEENYAPKARYVLPMMALGGLAGMQAGTKFDEWRNKEASIAELAGRYKK